ncbi:hypothetical protein Bbelb_040750 [Branchiostoma belcheri]|nr:hypothetical protein Bbelb_040750 [Branchiostoma belcheri]
MNGITSEMLKAEGDCVYAFPGIKLAFNGDHREVLEDWKNGSVVQLASHVKRGLLGMFSVSRSEFGSAKTQAKNEPSGSSFPWLSTGYLGGNRRKGPGVKGVPETKFADLDFADDIAENARDLQPLVTNIARLQAALGSASGPSINMLIGTHAPLRSVTIDENKLKVAENFTYLGSSTNNKGQMDNELDCRLGKASAAFNQLDFETYYMYVEISQEKRKETGITACF